jgi:hypothetical protein
LIKTVNPIESIKGGENMKKNMSFLLLCLLVVSVLSFPITGAFATKPVYASGTGSSTLIPVPVKFAGPNTFFEVTGTGFYNGDFDGTTVGVHRWHMNKDGQINMHVELVFTGSILGKSGTITMLCSGIAGKKLTWRIISGTGDLANLKGTGFIIPGFIEGFVHFDP